MQNRRGLFAGMQSGRLSGFVPYKGTKDLPNAGRISRFIRNFVDMKVALCQFSMEWEAAARNLRRAEELVAQAGADLALLPEMFAPGEISRLYINFPDPWPKKKQFKRRLTAPEFLDKYRALLPEGGAVWFKTDNGPLFDWSLESFRGCGWALADMPEGTPMTDYEARFTEMGLPIHRVVATRP